MDRFLQRPGTSGPVGALLDEYARAAVDFCDVLDTFSPDDFGAERASDDRDTVSPRAIGRHVCGAAFGYAKDIRNALGLDLQMPPGWTVASARDVREMLVLALRFNEQVLEPLRGRTEREVMEITFTVSWGATYDPESMMEHAIVHLLRHRRQLERWSP